jgi:tetratricopeptide (TPR) repeat protein
VSRPLAAIAAFLLLTAAAPAAPTPWWKSDWTYRKTVEMPREQRWTDARSAWVSITTCGHALPDGADVRVVDRRGKVLSHTVLGVGPGDRMEVAYEPLDEEPVYVYYGNPAPGRPRAPWRPGRGLVLETRRRGPGNPVNLAAMRRIWEASGPIDGARRWPRVFDAINPFGDDEDFVSRYRGHLRIPRAGKYVFYTASDEASFLLIDGKPVATWPGWHDARQGAWAKFKGEVTLSPGLVDFEYLHVERRGQQVMAAYWLVPGAKEAVPIPETAFPGLRDAHVVASEKRGEPVAADFEERPDGKVGYEERVLSGYRFYARETGRGGAVRYRWDFGDGCGGEGESPRHVYLRGGLFPVTLTAVGPKGSDVARRVVYVPGVWTRFDRKPPGAKEAFAAWIRDYPWSRMDEASVRVGEFFLRELREEEALHRLYRQVVMEGNEAIRPAEIARMALALGDLERDRAGDLEAAIRAYRKAATGGRRAAASARVRIARAIAALGDDPKVAVDLLEELIDGEDLWREDRRTAWIALGEAHLARGETDEARRAFDEARRYSSEKRLGADRIKAGGAARKASTLAREGKWLEALEQIDLWEDLHPPARLMGFSTVLRAECEIALERHAVARRRLRALVKLDPRGNQAARALWLLATSHEAAGEKDRARELFEEIARDHRDSPLAEKAGREADRLRGG